MIRMFLFAAGFVAITLVLVIYQPGSSRPSRDVPEPVTRAEPAALAPTAPAQIAAPATQALAQPAPAPRVAAPTASGTMDDQALRKMTWDTLSNLNTATGRESAPGQPGSLLHTIVRRSLEDGSAAPAPQAVVPDTYVVQAGDSLISIAEKVYGDVNMTGPLFAANQAFLTRPDDLRPGQRLVLPAP